jgi:hypothetical protein
VFADVRRGKSLSLLLQRVTIADTAGNPVRMTGADEPAPSDRPAPSDGPAGSGEPAAL